MQLDPFEVQVGLDLLQHCIVDFRAVTQSDDGVVFAGQQRQPQISVLALPVLTGVHHFAVMFAPQSLQPVVVFSAQLRDELLFRAQLPGEFGERGEGFFGGGDAGRATLLAGSLVNAKIGHLTTRGSSGA